MTPRLAAVAGFAAWLGALALSAPPALAQSRSTGEIRRSTLVQVYVAGTAETVARTRVAVQELVARLDLPTVVRDAAGANEELVSGERSAAMVNAYVDLRSLEAPRVIVADGATGEVVERRTLPPASSTEMAVEAVAHVLYMTVESVLRTHDEERPGAAPLRDEPQARPAQASAGAEPPPAAAPAERAVAASPMPVEEDESPGDSGARRASHAGWGASAAVFGTAASYGPERVLGGAGAGVEASARAHMVRPGLLATFALYAPGEVSGQAASGTLQSMAARLVPFVEWAAAERLAVQLGVGFGADFLRFDPGHPPPGAASLGTLQSTDFVVATQLAAKLGLTESVALLAGFGVDVDTAPRRYVVEHGPERASVFELARVRPQLFVGLGFSFAGTSQFARGQR